MNDIEKEIEEFKNNLVEIDKVSKELNNNSDILSKTLKDTIELEKIKGQLKTEIESLNNSNNDYLNKLDKKCDEIKEMYNLFVSEINKVKDKFDDTKKQISSQDEKIVSVQNKLSGLFKLEISLVILSIIIIIVLILK